MAWENIENKQAESLRREIFRAAGMTKQPYICDRCWEKFTIDMQPGLAPDEQAMVARCPRCGHPVTV